VTLTARNANEAMIAPMAGSGGVGVWRESGVRRSVCGGAFGRNLTSVAMVFSHLIHFINSYL
jgi:hypothetical protein